MLTKRIAVFTAFFCLNWFPVCASEFPEQEQLAHSALTTPRSRRALAREMSGLCKRIEKGIVELNEIWEKVRAERLCFPRVSDGQCYEALYHDLASNLLNEIYPLFDKTKNTSLIFKRLSDSMVSRFFWHLTNSAFLRLFAPDKIGCYEIDSPIVINKDDLLKTIQSLYNMLFCSEGSSRRVLDLLNCEQFDVVGDVCKKIGSSKCRRGKRNCCQTKSRGESQKANTIHGENGSHNQESSVPLVPSVLEIICIMMGASGLILDESQEVKESSLSALLRFDRCGEGDSCSDGRCYTWSWLGRGALGYMLMVYVCLQEHRECKIVPEMLQSEEMADLSNFSDMVLAGLIAIKRDDLGFARRLMSALLYDADRRPEELVFVKNLALWMVHNSGDCSDVDCKSICEQMCLIVSQLDENVGERTTVSILVRTCIAFLGLNMRSLTEISDCIYSPKDYSSEALGVVSVLAQLLSHMQFKEQHPDTFLKLVLRCLNCFKPGSILYILALNEFIGCVGKSVVNDVARSTSVGMAGRELAWKIFHTDGACDLIFRKIEFVKFALLLAKTGIDWGELSDKTKWAIDRIGPPSAKISADIYFLLMKIALSGYSRADYDKIMKFCDQLYANGQHSVAVLKLAELAIHMRACRKEERGRDAFREAVRKFRMSVDARRQAVESFSPDEDQEFFIGVESSHAIADAAILLFKYNYKYSRRDKGSQWGHELNSILFDEMVPGIRLIDGFLPEDQARLLCEWTKQIIDACKSEKNIHPDLPKWGMRNIACVQEQPRRFLSEEIVQAIANLKETLGVYLESSCRGAQAKSRTKKRDSSRRRQCLNGISEGMGSCEISSNCALIEEEDSDESDVEISIAEFASRLELRVDWDSGRDIHLNYGGSRIRPGDGGALKDASIDAPFGYPSFREERLDLVQYWESKENEFDIDLPHIFDLTRDRQSLFDGGFHHDPENVLHTDVDENAVYKTSFFFVTQSGERHPSKPSSFFPRSWSRVEVLDSIIRMLRRRKQAILSELEYADAGEKITMIGKDHTTGLSIKIVAVKPHNEAKKPLIRSAYPIGSFAKTSQKGKSLAASC